MAVRKFMKTSGVAALAVSMAMAAFASSASAQERGRWAAAEEAHNDQNAGGDGGSFRQRWNGGGGEARQRGERGGERGGWQQAAPQVQPAPQVQAQARIEAPEQRDWSGGDRGNWRQRNEAGATAQWNGGNRGSWSQGTATAQVQPAPQPQTRSWSGDRSSGEWAGRTQQQPQTRDWRDGDRERRNESWRNDGRTGDWRDSWRGNDRRADNWRGNDRRNDNWRDNNRTRYSGNYTAWNRDWRRDNRYNWYSWRNQNHDRFRMGYYYAPYRNWSYRRLSIGFYLDSLFYSSNYWIRDPWQYRLPDVYGPYRWVRYYDDALLVDVYSGQVVDVIYDFFW